MKIGQRERSAAGEKITLNLYVHCVLANDGDVWMGADGKILIWTAVARRLKKKLRAAATPIGSLVRIGEGENACVWSGAWDGSIRQWDAKTYKSICLIADASDRRPAGAFSGFFDKHIVWSGRLDLLSVWSLDGTLLREATVEPVSGSVEMPIVSAMCAVASRVWCAVGSLVLVYHAQGETMAVEKIIIGHETKVLCLCYEAQSGLVWSGDADGNIMIWSALQFDLVHALSGAHGGPVFDMEVVCMRLNDYTTVEVWSGSQDCLLRVWDAGSFHCVREMRGHTSPVVSVAQVDHSHVWSAGETEIHIWNQEQADARNNHVIPYENGDKYVGEISEHSGVIRRHGRGEMHIADGSRLAGHWVDDALTGFGVSDTADDEARYYGLFRDTLRHGRGTLVFRDGCVFEGVFVKGVRKGSGTMMWPNGDTLYGVWAGDAVTNAKLTRGAKGGLSVSRAARELARLELHRVDRNIEKESNAPLAHRTKRPPALPVSKWADLDAISDQSIETLKGVIEQRFAARLNADSLSIVLSTTDNPLGASLANFCFLFKATFHFSYGQVPQQLEHALDDTRSFCARLAAACGVLFPSVKKRQREELISEIVLSRIYTAILELYKSVNAKADQHLVVKIDSLSGVTMREVGVPEKFWLGWKPNHELRAAAPLLADSTFGSHKAPMPSPDSDDDNALVPESDDVLPVPHLGARRRTEAAERLEKAHAPYWNAVLALHELRRFKTVGRKLHALINVSQCILNAVAEYGGDEGSDMVLGSEDKFPILSYVTIRANVPALRSELQLIRDFAHPSQLREEAGYRLTELEQAVEYVDTLDWNLCDNDGVLMPRRVVEERMMAALRTATSDFTQHTTQAPRVLWIAELLLLCGTKRGATGFTIDALEYGYLVTGPDRDAYLAMGRKTLAVVGLSLKLEGTSIRVSFDNPLPLHLYTAMSHLVQNSVSL